MSDPALVLEILAQIIEATTRIERRFAPIQSPEDFLADDQGIDRLDAICMMLIAIGESLKHLDKVTGGELLERYPQVDWAGAKGIRDVISHHYFHVDAEGIYGVCRDRLPGLVDAVKVMRDELAGGSG
jgi:uncharacterized protein with HEPN domain